ncbi:MAG: hypothetical protein A2840_01370 [Candidatus Buchananbacteria bacterium RIFCSPHIGHO2_01_FULL_47_11b]|uniref:Peptidase C39 domain-containing protein n=1 Tax=Candidatus Buchananbacteria bacterium RIFCSPHIGHO2_01_FULL_47_11b TaxID=1797537 RepID=A0A1G1Y5Y7_9BACT|nr:MAG: hypothetical protein A2840_01370 [Candidatus Buchananbacteria bacterium RIFCSPHIGHO2_01_FULL_47_11b]
MKLKIPYHNQKTDYLCGPASLQMVLSFFGQTVSQQSLLKIAGLSVTRAKKVGTPNNKLVVAARRAGFYCYVNEDATLDEMRYYISIGLPVIVNYVEPVTKAGHFSVAVGFNRLTKKIILYDPDPTSRQVVKIPEREFLKLWHAGYQKHYRWLMVINKKPFKLGKQFYPIKSHLAGLPQSSRG